MPCKKITSQDRRMTETFISRMTYATVTSGLLVLLQTGQLSIVIIYVFVRSVGVRLFVCFSFLLLPFRPTMCSFYTTTFTKVIITPTDGWAPHTTHTKAQKTFGVHVYDVIDPPWLRRRHLVSASSPSPTCSTPSPLKKQYGI